MRVESLKREKLFWLQNQRTDDYCHHQGNKIIYYFYWMGERVTNLNDYKFLSFSFVHLLFGCLVLFLFGLFLLLFKQIFIDII